MGSEVEMDSREELLEIERQLWTGDAEVYRSHVDEHCLLVFSEMAGRLTREQVVGTVENGQRWGDLKLELIGLVEPASDVAILAYEANATREGAEPYHAQVSSGYVRRADGWKLMFHQQTPR